MTALLLRITNWEDTFERAGSRAVERCGYLCTPNKPDGMGMAIVKSQPDGAAIYGVYEWVAQRCSRQFKPNPKKSPDKIGRFDRCGWLTDDGLPSGKRWTPEALAYVIGRPLEEVIRMLQVVTREDVGWIQILEGEQTWIFNEGTAEQRQLTLAAPSTHHQSNTVTPPAHHQSADVPPSLLPKKGDRRSTDGPPLPIIAITEGTEEKRSPLLSPKGDGEGSVDGGTMVEQQLTIGDGEPSAEHRSIDDPLQYAEAERWLKGLFGRQKALSGEEMHLLSELLPLPREHQDLIEWAFKLPAAHQFYQHTELKQTTITLLREFDSEVDKIRSVRRKLGLNGLHAAAAEVEPEGWRNAHLALYGESTRMLESFFQYPPSSQKELREFLEKNNAEVAK